MEPNLGCSATHLDAVGTSRLVEQLDLLAVDDSPCLVSLADCRLQTDCLPQLLWWMEQRGGGTSVRVGGSGLIMGDICKALISRMGHIDWIRSGRIGVREGEDGRALDVVHAEGYLQGREVGMGDALHRANLHLEEAARINKETNLGMQRMQISSGLEHKKFMSELRMLHDSSKKLEAGTRSIRQWFDAHTDSFELLVTQLTNMYLRKVYRISHASAEVFELERTRHTIPKMPPLFKRGVEWDGVLYVPEAKHLFLVEAKSALLNEHVSSMATRMERTVEFINLCRGGKLSQQGTATGFALNELCRSWAAFGEATKVFGVVGGLGFSQHMLRIADGQGLLLVMPRDGVYDISLGTSQRLLSVPPPSPASDEHMPTLPPITISQQEVHAAATEQCETDTDDSYT